MNKKELMARLHDLLKSMQGETDPEKFKGLNDEFNDVKGQLDRLDAIEAAEKALALGGAKDAKPAQTDSEKAFAAAARAGFKGLSEGVLEDGGYTVPEDISTRIEKFRDAKAHLGKLVDVEKVKTNSGKRTFQKRGAGSGFAAVDEGGKIPMVAAPKFIRQSYTIEKYGGYMFATNELLADSDASITNTVVEWFGENDRVTRNKIVLATMEEPYKRTSSPLSADSIAGLDDLKWMVNVGLGQAFADTCRIVTNDDGLQFLDTLKDEEGRSLIKSDNADPMKRRIAIGFRSVPLEIMPNDDMPSDADKGVPFWVGDLKAGVRIYDRDQLSILASNVASIGTGDNAINAFGEDLTIWRGIERLDCQVKDEAAFRKGYYKKPAETEGSGGAGGTASSNTVG